MTFSYKGRGMQLINLISEISESLQNVDYLATYEYDNNGNITKIKMSKDGITIKTMTYTYYPTGNIKSETIDSASQTIVYTYTYDSQDNVLSENVVIEGKAIYCGV